MIKIDLAKLGLEYYSWSKKIPVGRIPYGVAKEGTGEKRIPLTHYANSVPVYLTFLKILRQAKKSHASVVDIGCGTGRSISYVKTKLNRSGWKFFGIDYSPACIKHARRQYGELGVNFSQHDGKWLPFPDKCFEYVVSSHVMEHIPAKDQLTFLQEIRRVLKPGGVAVIGEPNRKYCQDLFTKNPNETRKYRLILPHEHEHYGSELRQLYRQAKFSRIKIWQTMNPLARRLFLHSVKVIRPGNEFWRQAIFELYAFMRQNAFLQALMARIGTELLLGKEGASYEQIFKTTELWQYDKPDDGDNFIAVANK